MSKLVYTLKNANYDPEFTEQVREFSNFIGNTYNDKDLPTEVFLNSLIILLSSVSDMLKIGDDQIDEYAEAIRSNLLENMKGQRGLKCTKHQPINLRNGET